jgi:hypothetical protein
MVIDSKSVNKITASSAEIKNIMDDPIYGNLKPCLFFPEQ